MNLFGCKIEILFIMMLFNYLNGMSILQKKLMMTNPSNSQNDEEFLSEFLNEENRYGKKLMPVYMYQAVYLFI